MKNSSSSLDPLTDPLQQQPALLLSFSLVYPQHRQAASELRGDEIEFHVIQEDPAV